VSKGVESGWTINLETKTVQIEPEPTGLPADWGSPPSDLPADWGAPPPPAKDLPPEAFQDADGLIWYAHLGELLYTSSSPFSGHTHDMAEKCLQAWAYKKLLNCWPQQAPVPGRPEIDARTKGSMGHTALAHIYRRAQAEQEGEDPERFLPWHMAVQHWASKRDKEQRNRLCTNFVPTVIQAVNGYIDYWLIRRRESVRVLGVEHVLDFKPLVGFDHTRSADLILVDVDGLVYFWDHKFVGRLNTQTVSRYAMDGQFLDYMMIGRALYGDRFGGVKLNLITWPAKDQVEFYRDHVGAAPWAGMQRLEQMQETRARLDGLIAEGRDPWRYPKAMNETVCQGPYGLCDAFDLCRYGPEQSPGHARLAVLPGRP